MKIKSEFTKKEVDFQNKLNELFKKHGKWEIN